MLGRDCISYPWYSLFGMIRVYFYIVCVCCFCGCEKRQQKALSYKEVKTEVFILEGDEELPVFTSDITANLDTIDWAFRDKHGYLQPSVFIYVNNKTCETLSVYAQELYKKDCEVWTLLSCSVSQMNFENVIFPPGMVWSNSIIRFCFNGYDLEPGLYMLQSKMLLPNSSNSQKYCLNSVFLLE